VTFNMDQYRCGFGGTQNDIGSLKGFC